MQWLLEEGSMEFSLVVENIKCGGCASHITGKLLDLSGVESVDIEIEQGLISGKITDDVVENIKKTLAGLGYPEVGTQEGLEALGSKAKSFVSCAVGSINKDKN